MTKSDFICAAESYGWIRTTERVADDGFTFVSFEHPTTKLVPICTGFYGEACSDSIELQKKPNSRLAEFAHYYILSDLFTFKRSKVVINDFSDKMINDLLGIVYDDVGEYTAEKCILTAYKVRTGDILLYNNAMKSKYPELYPPNGDSLIANIRMDPVFYASIDYPDPTPVDSLLSDAVFAAMVKEYARGLV